MIKGVPVKFPVETTAGKDMTTLYFATAASCPELASMVKCIRRKANLCEKLAKKMAFVNAEWETATPDTVDVVFEKRETLIDEAEATHEQIETHFAQFVVKALVNAGYTPEAAESVRPLVPLDRFGEIWNAMRIGATMSDFSPAP